VTAPYVNLMPGDPAPWFHAASSSNPKFAFNSAAGRYIVMCFFGSAGEAFGASALHAVKLHRSLFDDTRFSLFGVSLDPSDRESGRAQEDLPGIRHFWDFDAAVSRAYGATPSQENDVGDSRCVRRFWLVMDPTLRVLKTFPFTQADAGHARVFEYLRSLPPPDLFAGMRLQAPVLLLPNIFEPDLCQKLVDLYESHGGQETGFMREVDGKTVGMLDPQHKRRRDHNMEDTELIAATQARIVRRVVPEIAKVHQFRVTRMERYIIGCYAAEDHGHFRPHRDNTTKGTSHRKFAVSINLNSDFAGGEVSFPEYGPQGFKPPPGGALVFSCSLLHAVSPVTRGRRYAFLPFLYDDAAARVREENKGFLADSVASHKAS
jgi:peroxiredoxin/predicted 2-oxoglutarate/Fe(II)-dependent dioxygenase YbiX